MCCRFEKTMTCSYYKIFLVALLAFAILSCNSGGRGTGPNPNYSGYPDTPFTIKDASQLIGGPVAQGRIGDVLLQNDKIRVIIQKPSKNAGLFSFGGIIIDADRVRTSGEAGRDEFGSIFPLVNVEWTINYDNYEVVSTGEDGGPKILRAHGKIDVYDYLKVDFITEVAQALVGQPITFSNRFNDRSDPFNVYDDLKGVDPEVITEYRLDPGINFVRMDTTFKNHGDKDASMPVGDIVNGSGELQFLIPGLGFSPDLMAQAAGDTPAIIYAGFDNVDVSYGYFYDLTQFQDKDGKRLQSGSLTYSGVTFALLGETVLKILPLGTGGVPEVHFSIPANGERTITRYFVVGDGSAQSVFEGGLTALGIKTQSLSGTVVASDGNAVNDATVAVQKKGGGTVVTLKTDASGRFSGVIPAGEDPFSVAVGNKQYHIVVGKAGYQKNGTAVAGACDPEDIDLSKSSSPMVKCALGEAGFIKLSAPVIDASTGQPIAARMIIVGEDPSQEGEKVGIFGDINEFRRHFGVVDNQYITARGTFGLTGQSSFTLEPGSYHFVFSHGTEYGAVEKDVTIEAGKTTTLDAVSIERAVTTPGYISGDFHMHSVVSPDSWIAPEKRVIAAAAEGMDVLQSSDHDYHFDYAPVIQKMTDLGQIPAGSFAGSVVGVEITPNHYGHIHAFPMVADPASPTGGSIVWSATPLDEVSTAPDYCMSPNEIAQAVKAVPGEHVVQLNHISDSPTGLPVASGWVTSRFYLESGAAPLSSYADPVMRRLTPHTGDPIFPLPFGTSSLVTTDMTATELMIGFDFHDEKERFLKSTLPTWFNFLNMGLLVTATGSSDSHDEYDNPMGLPRNFIASSVDPRDGKPGAFDPDAYANAINEHRVIVSAGPFVTVEATGKDGNVHTIGDLVPGTEINLKIMASAPSWAWFDTIEIYANTEPIPIDDDLGNAMSGDAKDPAKFYKPYHVPKYGYKPLYSYRLADSTLANWKEDKGVITAQVETKITVSEDTWVVVLVRGTSDTKGYRSLFPIVTNVLKDSAKKPKTFDPLNLADFHASPLVDAFAFALANPILIDADGDGKFSAKYVSEGTSPVTP